MMPLGDVFMKEFNINSQAYSILVSAYSIGAFFSSLVGIFLFDRWDRKRSLLCLMIGFSIGTLCCGVSNSYYPLLFIRFLTGMFGGVLGALALAIISDVFPFAKRGAALGILFGAFSVASAIGVPFALYVADTWDWHIPFIIVGIIGCLITVFIQFRFPKMVDHIDHTPRKLEIFRTFSGFVKNRNQFNALSLGFILVFGHFIIIPFVTPYMIRNVGFSQTEVIYIYLAGGIATAFFSPWFGRLTDKIGAVRLFYILVVLSFIPVLVVTHLKPVAIPLALLATASFFVLGSGRMIPPQTLITAAVGPENRGSFMSIKAALQQLSVALASVLAGWIVVDNSDYTLGNYNIVGYISVGVLIIAMLVAPLLKVAKGN